MLRTLENTQFLSLRDVFCTFGLYKSFNTSLMDGASEIFIRITHACLELVLQSDVLRYLQVFL